MSTEALSRLAGKEHSPLIIRKYTFWGFPLYVALIADMNLDGLDTVVRDFMDEGIVADMPGDGTGHDCFSAKPGTNGYMRLSQSIQDKRNLAGLLTDRIACWCTAFGKPAEGVAVIYYVDKMMVSSLFGDFMNHTSCRIELYSLLNMMCHV